MTSEFSTFGSCASRNIFNSDLNKDYKDYFHINHSIERVNTISLMSDPVDFNGDLVNAGHEYDNTCVIEDLSKRYLDSIKNHDFDYILFDTLFDVKFSVIKLNSNSFITDSYSLESTDLYGDFKECRRISIFEDFDEYFSLWKKYFDDFFICLKDYSPDTKLILNCARSIYTFKEDDSIVEDSQLKEISLSYNKYRNVLDRHIIENYDVEILPFDYGVTLDKNHIFGIAPTHYVSKFYEDANRELNKVIANNKRFEWEDDVNINIRNLKKEAEVLKMKLYDLENYDLVGLEDENVKLKDKYNSILNSKSWKLTGPLRNLKKRI